MDKRKKIEGTFTFLCTLVPVVVVIVFIICAVKYYHSGEYHENTKCIESYFDLEVICDNGASQICYDRNTSVLYYKFSGTDFYDLTPILNSDGTPKLYRKE